MVQEMSSSPVYTLRKLLDENHFKIFRAKMTGQMFISGSHSCFKSLVLLDVIAKQNFFEVQIT